MAGGYDGEIRIRTLIENGKASSQLLQLEAKFQKLTSEAKKLSDGMREIEQQKIPTEEYKAAQDQFNKDSAALDKLIERMDKFQAIGGKTDSKAFKSMQYDAEQLKKSIEYVSGELQAMKDSGTAYVDTKSTAEYQKKAEKLWEVNRQLDTTKRKMEEVAAKEVKTGAESSKLEKVVSAANRIKNAFSGATKTIGNFGSRAVSICGKVIGGVKNAANRISGLFKKSNGLLNTFSSRLKGISLSLLVFNWITKAFNAMVAAFKEGIQSMAKYSADFNSRMSELKTATSTLKASLGALAAPIVSAVVPAIVTLCNWLTTAVNKINMLISALSGKSTWTQAKKQQVDYAKSLNSTAAAAKKAAGALQGFDELNVISSNNSGSDGSGSDTGNVAYEEMPISDSAKKIKDILAGEDWTELGKIIADKLNDAMKNIPWDSIQTEAEKTGKRIGTLINGFVGEFDWNLLGATIAQGVNTALIFLNTFLETVDWSKVGSAIASGINGFIETTDWSLLGSTICNGINAAIDVLYGLVTTLDWEKIGSSIGTSITNVVQNIKWEDCGEALGTAVSGLITVLDEFIKNTDWGSIGKGIVDAIGGFFTTIDWGTIGETISSALIALCDFFTGTMKEIDWSGIPKYVVDSISDFLTNFDWTETAEKVGELLGQALRAAIETFAGIWDLLKEAWGSVKDYFEEYIEEAGGNVIEGLYNGILDALKSVGRWIKENIFDPFIKGFKNAFGIHSPSTVMKKMGAYIIEGLKLGLKDIWNKVKSIIENLKANIKKAFTSIKTNTIAVFTSMKNTVVNIFKGIWNGIKGIINNIIGGIEKMANSVISGLNSMINAMNKLSWDIPDWVPKIGGNKFGISIPTIASVSIPRLANGCITTGSTLANIGEAGREAVLPLENNLSYLEPLADMIASKMEGVQTVRIVPDKNGIFKVVREEANSYYRRTGNPAFDF